MQTQTPTEETQMTPPPGTAPSPFADEKFRQIRDSITALVNAHYATWSRPLPYRVIALNYSKRVARLAPGAELAQLLDYMMSEALVYIATTPKGKRVVFSGPVGTDLILRNKLETTLEQEDVRK